MRAKALDGIWRQHVRPGNGLPWWPRPHKTSQARLGVCSLAGLEENLVVGSEGWGGLTKSVASENRTRNIRMMGPMRCQLLFGRNKV